MGAVAGKWKGVSSPRCRNPSTKTFPTRRAARRNISNPSMPRFPVRSVGLHGRIEAICRYPGLVGGTSSVAALGCRGIWRVVRYVALVEIVYPIRSMTVEITLTSTSCWRPVTPAGRVQAPQRNPAWCPRICAPFSFPSIIHSSFPRDQASTQGGLRSLRMIFSAPPGFPGSCP